jgi:hypothetical protein
LGNNGLKFGGGGVALAVLGSVLVGSGTGPFVLGLLILLVGVGLIVHLLLQATEGSTGRPAAQGSGTPRAGLGDLLKFTGVRSMSEMSRWVAGACMGALSLLGLFLYSRATDSMFGLFGGLLFLFGIAVIIVFVHQATDYSGEAQHHGTDENHPDQGQATT